MVPSMSPFAPSAVRRFRCSGENLCPTSKLFVPLLDGYQVRSLDDLVKTAHLTVAGRIVGAVDGKRVVDEEAGTTEVGRILQVEVEEVLSGDIRTGTSSQPLLIDDFGTLKYKDRPSREVVVSSQPRLTVGQSGVFFLRESPGVPGAYNLMGGVGRVLDGRRVHSN